MRTLLFIVLLLLPFHLLAGGRSRAPKIADIDTLHYIDPFSHISLVSVGSEEEFNDSLTQINRMLQEETLQKYRSSMKLAATPLTTDSVLQQRILKELLSLHKFKRNWKTLTYNEVAPTLAFDSLMEASGRRYLLFVADVGYLRTKENFKKERRRSAALGLATGLLTLGNAIYVNDDAKHRSVLSVTIYDARENKAYRCFSGNILLEVFSPVEPKTYQRQFREAFNELIRTRLLLPDPVD